MRSAVLLFSIGFLFLLVHAGGWLANYLALREETTPFQDSLSTFIEHEMLDKQIPGLSIVVVEEQNTLFEDGYGLSNFEKNEYASPYTVYRGGALAQLFTTIAVLQRVEHDRLDLDEPIARYLTWFKPDNLYGLPLTLRQLLSNQSGLPTETPVGHYFDQTHPDLDATVYSLNKTRVVYPPEMFTKPSNAGFGVAGMILETTLEKPFERHMRAILDRMDLKRTSFAPRYDLRKRLSTGYISSLDGRLLEAPHFELSNAPAANLYTTVNDLGAFLKVVFADGISPKGLILNPDSFEEMWTVQLATVRHQVPYGLGFMVSLLDNERLASLTSSLHGFSAYIAILPDRDMGVALLANLEHAESELERIGAYALRLLLAQKDEQPLPVRPILARPDSAMIARAMGYYGADDLFYITRRGNELYLHRDFARTRLRQQGDSLIQDDRHRAGQILIPDGVSLQMDNTIFPRREPEPTAPPSADLAGLIGMYGSPGNPVLILENDGALYALKDWVNAYPLRAEAADSFALPDDGLYGGEFLVFTRGENGVATAVEFAHMKLPRSSDQAFTFDYSATTFQAPEVKPVAADARPSFLNEATSDTSQIVDLTVIDPLLNLDVRYASADNIFGAPLYAESRAFLQHPVAEALFRVQAKVRRMGLGLVIYDAYQPWRITNAIWNAVPDSLHRFFDDPSAGSCQNRAAAIDLSLYNLETDELLPMPSLYGDLSSYAVSDFPVFDNTLRWNRDMLRRLMESEGFYVSPYRWWHFSHQSCERYPALDIPFEELIIDDEVARNRIFTVD